MSIWDSVASDFPEVKVLVLKNRRTRIMKDKEKVSLFSSSVGDEKENLT